MPTYEYACMDCGTHVEVFQHFADDPLTTCGVCGGRLRKVFHPAGILFKGSGFYRTDNRPKSTSESATGESKGAGKAAPASKSGSSGSSSESSGSSSSGSSSGGSGSSSRDSGSSSSSSGQSKGKSA